MALSGSFIGAGGTSSPGVNYQLRVDWSATQDYASNTSTITCTFYLVQNPSWSISIGSRSNKCTIDGVAIAWTSPTVSNGGGTTTQIGSCSRVVSHNADGSKSLNITAVYATAPLTISGVYISEITASADITLDSIPRASVPSISASSVTMRDGALTIDTNRASADFTHTLTYTFGNASGTIATGVTDSCRWVPPLSLASQIPNAPSGTAVITCTTYSGDTQIGSSQLTTVQLVVPSDVVPSVSASWSDTSGAFDLVGAYVQNVTKLSVAVAGTGAYGSSIAGASMTLNGKAYTGGVITDSGELELLMTVKDSRGRLGSTPYTITVAPYAAPSLIVAASRCQEDGTADDTGEYALITIIGSTTQVNDANAAALSLTYGGTIESVEVSVGDFTHTQIVDAPSESTMSISATLSDKLLTVPRSMVLSTGYATLDFLKGGKGIAFGKTATEEGFACAMDTDFCEHKVTGLPAPVDNSDAVNKEYADENFAPAGYGLGKIVVKDWANVDSVKASGWYTFYSDVSIDGHAFGAAVMRADRLDNNMLIQTVYPAYDSMTELKRMCLGGEWQSWEWKNPPMILNTEYRTTERWKGKPVFTKLVDCGYLPENDRKKVPHGAAATQIIRCVGQLDNGDALPRYWESDNYCWIYSGTENIVLYAGLYASEYQATAQIWYTKD